MAAPDAPKVPYGWRGFLGYFLRLGTFGFGGPIALAGHMQRDLVEARGWISPEEYREGLALSQLAPGPLAAQLAIYLGWLRGGFVGATLVGIVFVLPSFAMVLLLAWAYVRFGGLAWLQAAFYGIGAVVIAIIAFSAWKLVRRTVKTDPLLWTLFTVSAGITAWTEREMLWVFVLCGLVAVAIRAAPRWRTGAAAILPLWALSGLRGPAPAGTLGTILVFFGKAGAVVFGSGLAIVPFLHGGVVQEYGWLNERQFLDAVAVAMITPGPVVITVGFIGWLVAGFAGACAAAAAVFFPCWLVVVAVAPFYRRIAENPSIKALVDGVTASAIGAIAGAVIVLGRRAIVDVPTAVLFAGGLLVVVRFKRIPEPATILAAGLLGWAAKSMLGA